MGGGMLDKSVAMVDNSTIGTVLSPAVIGMAIYVLQRREDPFVDYGQNMFLLPLPPCTCERGVDFGGESNSTHFSFLLCFQISTFWALLLGWVNFSRGDYKPL